MAGIEETVTLPNEIISPLECETMEDDAPISDLDSSSLIRTERKWMRQLSIFAGSHQPDAAGSSLQNDGRQSKKLGIFQGVFCPVALSMFSSLLFLRVGYVVGNAGILESMLQLFISYGIIVCTVLSICAVATNGAVEGGGVYFMISRTLGPELGGSVGILFYMANIVGSALYSVGAAEGLVSNFGPNGILAKDILPDGPWWLFLYEWTFNILNIIVGIVGAGMFGRTSAAMLIVVSLCAFSVIGSFFQDVQLTFPYNETVSSNCTVNCSYQLVNGSFQGFPSMSWSEFQERVDENLYAGFSRDCEHRDSTVNFMTVFGVLFSGVTGIMAGANLSGDLREPSKAIPKGTLLGVSYTFSVYFTLFLFTGLTCNRALLYHDCLYMSSIELWGPFVSVGALVATFCASLSGMIGASRVLQAVAKDTIFGPFLEFVLRGTVGDNPIAAVVFTGLLTGMCFFVGSLNKIAQLCSVLFLMSYATINLACLGLDLASAPNFRPAFKFYSWHTCLLGLIGTISMMFMISPVFSVVGIVLCISIIFVLSFMSPAREQHWGSISQALIFHQVRKYLLLLDPRKDHVKFWRPQILLLISNPRYSCALIDFVNALKKGGLYILGHVQVGNLESLDEDLDPSITQTPYWWSLIDHLKVKAFVEITVANSIREGIQQLVRISGIGAMKPNTIIFGYSDDDEVRRDDFEDPSSDFTNEKLSKIFPKLVSTGNEDIDEQKRIDKRLELIRSVSDVLMLRKNVCICRNFQDLDRRDILSHHGLRSFIYSTTPSKLYIDVWLMDFFSDSASILSDVSSLFLLQLGCVVNMAARWKKLKLRVWIRVMESSREEEVKTSADKLLKSLRISAESKLVHFEEVYRIAQESRATVLTGGGSLNLKSLPDSYMYAVNSIIKDRSQHTAVSFFYLPRPPQELEDQIRFMELLTVMTNHLPPSILVHGISPVISTSI